MERVEFERVCEAFWAFHAEFAPVFGRKQWRQRSGEYLQGLLVQSQERRNAENLAEVAPASARVLQRFLTEAGWDDQAVIEALQKDLGPRLADSEAVWVVDESGFVKQGQHSVGVARQYWGTVGKVANCQMGVFRAHVGPKDRWLVDKRLYLRRAWTEDTARCDRAGVPEEAREYQSKAERALAMLRQAKAWGYLKAEWVTGDEEYGKSPVFRDAVAEAGWRYVLEVPSNTPVWGRDATGERVRQEMRERAGHVAEATWQTLTVAEGAQGPRRYRFAAERVQESCEQAPGKALWAVYRTKLDGSQPRYYVSNAPPETPLFSLARVAASRWPIETELEMTQSLGLDEYEVRRGSGWHHHITLCLLASAFLLRLQQT